MPKMKTTAKLDRKKHKATRAPDEGTPADNVNVQGDDDGDEELILDEGATPTGPSATYGPPATTAPPQEATMPRTALPTGDVFSWDRMASLMNA